MSIISDYYELWMITLCGLMIISIIAFIVMAVRFSKLRRNYLFMLKGKVSANLEQVMIEVHNNIAQIESKLTALEQRVKQNEQHAKLMKANVGIQRYNAYDQQGSDLSFSIAFVDDYKNGAVLTGLHSREQTFIYAKKLEAGESIQQLSPEEIKAINQAVNKVEA